jgi:predicted house-cleaning noncanonical NTP pyrophosphatase (MazG superfamily)
LSKTSNKNDLIEELADLQEILLALYENEKISVKEIESVRKNKLKSCLLTFIG